MENSVFSSPQRQSKIGVLLLTIINLGKYAKSAWPMYLIMLVKYNPGKLLLILGFIILPIIFFAIVAVVQYHNFSYFINKNTGEFIINNGIINKKKITIERGKIQEVNINQPFIHRLLNIYKLEIDSPGSDKKEVTVNAISYENALELKNYLLEQKHKTTFDTAENFQTEGKFSHKFIKISTSSLLKYGLTANYLRSFVAVIAFGFYIFQNILELYRDNSMEEVIEEKLKNLDETSFAAFSFLGLFIVVLVIFLLGISANLIINLIKYFGLKISENNERLSLEYGLLNKKNAIISRQKVQMITEMQNFLQKKLNVLHLKFSQIAEDENDKDSFHAIPGCNTKERNELIQFLWKTHPVFKFSLKPNFRKVIPNFLILVIIPIIIGVFVRNELGIYFSLVSLYAILATVFIVFSFLNNRLFYDENFIRTQTGVWDINKKTIQIEKVQSVEISQFFWQKKSNLGSVRLVTAGGDITFKTAHYTTLKKLINFAIYKVESSKKDWK